MSDKEIKAAADAAARGLESVSKEAAAVVNTAVAAAEAGDMSWTVIESPAGLKALQGNCKGFQLLTTQARIIECDNTIQYRGTALNTSGTGPLIVVLPPATAERIFRIAEAAILAKN